MGISDSIVQSSRVIGSAVTSVINWEDIEICPICKTKLVDGKCPKGHPIKL